MKSFIAALLLPVNSTEDEVLTAVKNILSDNVKLTVDLRAVTEALNLSAKAIEVSNELQAHSLIKNALNSGKLTIGQKDYYTKLAIIDFETTKSVIDGMKVHVPLSSIIQ